MFQAAKPNFHTSFYAIKKVLQVRKVFYKITANLKRWPKCGLLF